MSSENLETLENKIKPPTEEPNEKQSNVNKIKSLRDKMRAQKKEKEEQMK